MKRLTATTLLLTPALLLAQSYTSYFTGSTTDLLTQPRGGVCLMGGATEHDEAMRRFLIHADSGDVLVLRASGADGYNAYLYSQLGIPVNSVETIVCNSAAASADPYVLQRIQQAEAIWFAGGDQWDYVSYWRGTAVDSLVRLAMAQRKVVVGGTSAGMAILGEYYFTAENGTVQSSTALADPYFSNVTVGTQTFMQAPWLARTITDTHYDSPDRRGRQVVFMARLAAEQGMPVHGIACDEYTAVFIDSTGIAHAYGDFPTNDDNAYFLQAYCTGPETLQSGTPLTWAGDSTVIKVYQIKATPAGNKTFDLRDWGSGAGGTWRHWYVVNGVLYDDPGVAPDSCLSVSRTDAAPAGMRVWPVPAQERLHVALPQGARKAEVLDMQGRVMAAEQCQPGEMEKMLDLRGLPAGMYWLRVNAGEGIAAKRFCISQK